MPVPIAASNIAAQAFRAMELSPISSFADTSPQAADAAEQYQVALDGVLETCDWSFASRLTSLPPAALPEGWIADEDLPGLFALPSDCVKIREIRPDTVKWRKDGRYIRADQATALTIRYTVRIEDEAQLPQSFQTAVAWALAVLLSPRWVGSRNKRRDLQQQAADYLKEAERNDAVSASPQPTDAGHEPYGAPDWVRSAIR